MFTMKTSCDLHQLGFLTSEAFGQEYIQGMRQTIRFLLSKGADIDLAEELAQAAWARGWEAREQLQCKDCLVPWVNTIAFRCLCNDRRRFARQSQLPPEVLDSRNHDFSTALDAKFLLAHCSPFERALLNDRYVNGRELKEIAASKSLSEIAVRLRIHRCQRTLRAIGQRGSKRVKVGVEQWLTGLKEEAPLQAACLP